MDIVPKMNNSEVVKLLLRYDAAVASNKDAATAAALITYLPTGVISCGCFKDDTPGCLG